MRNTSHTRQAKLEGNPVVSVPVNGGAGVCSPAKVVVCERGEVGADGPRGTHHLQGPCHALVVIRSARKGEWVSLPRSEQEVPLTRGVVIAMRHGCDCVLVE